MKATAKIIVIASVSIEFLRAKQRPVSTGPRRTN